MTYTRTHVTLFDTETVDDLVGAAHRALETDYLQRKDHMSKRNQLASEARLQTLRAAWILLLDRAQDD